jgi:Flp pilus assembly protein TadG
MQMLLQQTATRRKRRGAIVLLATLCLIIVIAFLAFSVDFGYIVVAESELQNAADAGALSGARALPNGREEAIAVAQTWAGKNTAAGENVAMVTSEDVEIGFWEKNTASFTVLPPGSPQSPNAVRVTCRRTAARGNPLTLFFAPILGVDEADLAVSAIAIHNGGSCGGIMALNRVYLREDSYTDSFDSTIANYYAGTIGANGDVCTNGHIRLLHNAGINGDAHPGPEEDGVEMGATNYVTGEIKVLEDYIDFPPVNLGNVATSNNNDQIPDSANGANLNDGKLDLDGGDSLDLPPGTYHFTELNLTGNSIIRVNGPTYIYIAGNVELTEGGIINQTLLPMNLQIYPLGTQFWLPNDIDLYAVIYSTTSAIEKAGGSGGFFGKMVGQKIKINGSGGLHVDESLVFGDLLSGGEQLGTSTGASLVY